MTRTARTAGIALLVLLALSADAVAAPPPRPLALTASQFDALRQLETQPDHAALLDTHASFQGESDRLESLEATRLSDDIFTVAWTGGFPATILVLLIAAAPL